MFFASLRLTSTFLILILMLMSATVWANSTQKNALILGSVASDTPAVMHTRLTPLTKYLTRVLGRPVTLKLSPNMQEAIGDLVNNKVDIAYLTPVAYIKSHDLGQTQLIAKTITNDKSSFQLMIAVKNDSSIKSVNDLKGKSFAFGDRAAILQQATVVGAGIKLEELGSYDYLGHYDNIVRSILIGDYDAGILTDTTAERWQSKGIRVIYASPTMPPYNLAASKSVDISTLRKIQNALFSLDIRNPEHKKVISALDSKYGGFAITKDDEYDVIRKLTAPFQNN